MTGERPGLLQARAGHPSVTAREPARPSAGPATTRWLGGGRARWTVLAGTAYPPGVLPSLQGLPELWRTLYRGRGFTLRAVAREPREAAMARAEGAVQARRGDILDFKMFTDLALNLLVELEAAEVVALADELGALGWPVDLEPPREALLARAGQRLEGTVRLDFPEGSGELVIPLPKVPG